MRAIKFRAWVYKKMTFIFTLEEVFKGGEFLDWSIDDAIIMQFTGLKDKNGKEIYEGDIIKHLQGEQEKELYEFKGIVKFQNCSFIIYTENSYCSNLCFYDLLGSNQILWCWHGSHGKSDYFYIAKDFEVIGNIYENPELLNETLPC